MKKLILLVLTAIFLQAGLLDFRDITKAKKSYESKDYKSAISEYKKVQSKDGATYDLANSYYKAKKYKKALSEYKKVTNPNLKFQKLHNMGNTYANLGKIDEAIKSYEDALKIKQDKDTKYNLDLLKKQKKKQHKKKNKKKNKKKKKQDKRKNKKNKNQDKQQKGKGSKSSKKTKGNRQKQNQNKNKEQKNAKQQNEKNQKQAKKQAMKKKKAQPISDMEERKYKKMLNKRGINTLMLPLSTKGDKEHEKHPW
jgi:Ca-activated chloride channel family protein